MKLLLHFSLATITAVLLFTSCAQEQEKTVELIPKLAAPLQLNFDRTLIYLDDYLPDSLTADSVFIQGKPVDFYQTKKTILFNAETYAPLPPLMEMKIWVGGNSCSVLLKKSKKEYFLFQFDPQDKKVHSVELAGEFNGWVPSKTKLTPYEGIYGKRLLLNKGEYQYQVVIDGKWQLNPRETKKVDNGQGGYNSVLSIGKKSNSLPVLITNSYTDDNIIINTYNNPTTYFAFWNNKRINDNINTVNPNQIKIKIPIYAKQKTRSFIRVYSFNSHGASNEILIPLSNGKVIDASAELSRTDFHSSIIYNVFVDRFYDGDSLNNWPLPDSIVLPPANYMGGDIAGVINKTESGYFKNLGITTLWLSPVIRNTEGAYGFWPNPKTKFSAYHGYWPISFNKIDRHFGTAKELKKLTAIAHENNENIIMDFVANHVHKEHPYYIAHPDCATNLVLPDGSLNLEKWDEHRLTTWFDTFLPTLDLEKPEIANMLTDSVVWWAEEYNLDGFRYDAAKHIPLSFWRLLTKKLKERIPREAYGNLYQLGETYGNPELISSYISNGLLDAQFDFNVYDAALQAFAAGGSINNLSKRLKESLSYYGNHNLMGYITGNQDRGRFISYAGGSLKFDEDPKAAGWTRDVEVGDSLGYKKLQMLMAFNMTIPGIPVIYYGDEFGMAGGNDPDCRRMMRFDNQLTLKEKENWRITQHLIQLRRNNLALTYGDLFYFDSTDPILIYARKYFDNLIIIAFNNSNTSKDIEINISHLTNNMKFTNEFGNDYKAKDHKIIMKLAPWSFNILKQE